MPEDRIKRILDSLDREGALSREQLTTMCGTWSKARDALHAIVSEGRAAICYAPSSYHRKGGKPLWVYQIASTEAARKRERSRILNQIAELEAQLEGFERAYASGGFRQDGLWPDGTGVP